MWLPLRRTTRKHIPTWRRCRRATIFSPTIAQICRCKTALQSLLLFLLSMDCFQLLLLSHLVFLKRKGRIYAWQFQNENWTGCNALLFHYHRITWIAFRKDWQYLWNVRKHSSSRNEETSSQKNSASVFLSSSMSLTSSFKPLSSAFAIWKNTFLVRANPGSWGRERLARKKSIMVSLTSGSASSSCSMRPWHFKSRFLMSWIKVSMGYLEENSSCFEHLIFIETAEVILFKFSAI